MAKKKVKTAQIDEKRVESAILSLVAGYSDSDVLDSIDGDHAALEEARRRIKKAAFADRELQLGISMERCNEIYRTAVKDPKTLNIAMTAQREINKVLGLTEKAAETAGGDGEGEGEGEEMRKVREYLLPLKLAKASYPLSEHARLAADVVREWRSNVEWKNKRVLEDLGIKERDEN